VSASLLPSAISFFFLGWDGLLVCLFCLGITALLAFWFWRKIGGWTGDTLGATSEIVEIVPAFVVIALAAGRAG
jgi:adenosylcobinamide-GDP ribazoletransferase